MDGGAGTFRDANIRDYDFIEGYAWRVQWADFEVARGVYDFTSLAYILDQLALIDKKLSILIIWDLPTYLIESPEIDTWEDDGVLKPSPWDVDLQARHREFVTAFAEYAAPDPAENGALVAMKDHSMLSFIHVTIPGMPRNSLRNGDTTNVADVPGFTRENLAQAIGAALGNWNEHFPAHAKLMSLWTIQDSNRAEPLWQFAQEELARHGNVGLFQDNLQARQLCNDCDLVTGPPEEGMGQALSHEVLWSGLQMLGSWLNPAPQHQDNLEGGIPDQGIDYAFNAFGTLYYEVYVPDLDNVDWHQGFRQWQELFAAEVDNRERIIEKPQPQSTWAD